VTVEENAGDQKSRKISSRPAQSLAKM